MPAGDRSLSPKAALGAAQLPPPGRWRFSGGCQWGPLNAGDVQAVAFDVGRRWTKAVCAGQPLADAVVPTPPEVARDLAHPLQATGAAACFLRKLMSERLLVDPRNTVVVICCNAGDDDVWGSHLEHVLRREVRVHGVQRLCTQPCALAAAGVSTGLVVDIGWNEARAAAVVHGRVLPSTLRVCEQAGAAAVLRRLGRGAAAPAADCGEAHLEDLMCAHGAAAAPPGAPAEGIEAECRAALGVLFDGRDESGDGGTLQALALAALSATSVAFRRQVAQCVVFSGGLAALPCMRERFAAEVGALLDLLDDAAACEQRDERRGAAAANAAAAGRAALQARERAAAEPGDEALARQAERAGELAAAAEAAAATARAAALTLSRRQLRRAVDAAPRAQNYANAMAAEEADVAYWDVLNGVTELAPGLFLAGDTEDGPRDLRCFGLVVRCCGEPYQPEHGVRAEQVVDGWTGGELGPFAAHFDAVCAAVSDALAQGRSVLFHCEKGQGRGPAAAIMYLVRAAGATFDSALNFVVGKRPVLQLPCLPELERWAGPAGAETVSGPDPPDAAALQPARGLRSALRFAVPEFPAHLLALTGASALASSALTARDQPAR